MKNKKTILIAVVIAIAILSLGVYLIRVKEQERNAITSEQYINELNKMQEQSKYNLEMIDAQAEIDILKAKLKKSK